MSSLRLTFRFLNDTFHGRADAGKPEWPPSPLRAFQALVAASARSGTLPESREAFLWLERLSAPLIYAPQAELANVGYRLSVPHNAMDIVGRQWAKDREGTAAEHRAMKDVRPLRLPEKAELHFVWQLGPEVGEHATSHAEVLIEAARHVVALGWGVDLVVGDGALEQNSNMLADPALKTWEPRVSGNTLLRTPRIGTLDDLDRRYAAFLQRTSLGEQTLRPPPVLSSFDVSEYARTDARPVTPVATFALMRMREDRKRAFDTARRGMAVSGMVRHAARTAVENAGWTEERLKTVVMGHGEKGEPRLLLIPIPSIERRQDGKVVVTAIRRLVVASTELGGDDVSWMQRSLGGGDLIDEKTGEVVAVLAASSRTGFEAYLKPSRTWVTVTPVVLPGLDDPGGVRAKLRAAKSASEQKPLLERLARRREGLIRKALRHAGLDDETAFAATIETSSTGYVAGVERVDRYAVPRHLQQSPRLHARIVFDREVAGPLCIGRGRFSGMGLLASL